MPNPLADALRRQNQPKAPVTPRPELLRALGDPEFYRRDLAGHGMNAAKGIVAGVMGAPVDLATMAMRPFGFGVPEQDVYGSSEYIGQRLGADTDRASYIAGLIGAPDAMDAGKVASLVGDYGPLLATAPISKMRLYRAHGGDDLKKIHKRSVWTRDKDTAVSYTDNPGYGGPDIRKVDLDESMEILDIGDPSSREGLERLAEGLGYDNPSEKAQEWIGNGWLYPWEESGEVAKRLEKSKYHFLEYVDDYPEGANAMKALKDIDISK